MIIEAARSFTSTLLRNRSRSRTNFEAWQMRQVKRWLAQDVPRVPQYGRVDQLVDLPVIDKADLMANFEAFNTHAITAEQVRKAMQSDCRIGNLTVGASTGTSGNRGLFVISEQERFRWLGSILAKTIPDMLLRKQRVAILLPQGGALYDSARKARIDLAFFSLLDGPETWIEKLEVFNPTVVVAPPKVLRVLSGTRITPTRVFSAAETLDPMDRTAIEARFGEPLEQIYMATEGLLGVTCRHGQLHLAEDSVHFEFEHVGDGLVSPIISSFRRSTQILARYRMNDLLRLANGCSCGSSLQAVAEVVGRMDDIFQLGNALVTPDVLRNTVLDASRAITDFRLEQLGDQVMLRLQSSIPNVDAERARLAVQTLLDGRNFPARVTLERSEFSLDPTRKLRRVARLNVK